MKVPSLLRRRLLRHALCAGFALGSACHAAEDTPENARLPLRTGMVATWDLQVPPVKPVIPDLPHPFGKAPAIGVHPRVLFGPEDLPRIRKELKDTACGRRAYAAITGWAGNATGGDKKPLGKVWKALVAGDLKALDYAESEWWRANISGAVGMVAFLCMVDENPQRTQDCCAALTTLAKILNGRTIAYGAAKSNPDLNLGLAYDMLYNAMTDEQRKTVRAAIAASTNGKRSHGMDMKPEQRTYNFMSHGMGLVVETLCIEGEEGYDAVIYPKSVEVLRDFLTYGVYPHGAPREGMHYYNFGMGSGGAMALIAFARRGDNLLAHPHFQAALDWYLHDMEPFGYAFSQHCDTANDSGGLLPNYIVMKKFRPNDPVTDFVWRNRIHDDYSGLNYRGDFLLAAFFPSDWQGGANGERTPVIDQWGADADKKPEAKPAAPWDAAALNQPVTFYDPDRGLLMTRSGWDRNALALHFECKQDEGGPSHSHANRNDFSLSALGRKWAIDRGFAISESKHHNMILIDGRGEGTFCGSGKVISYLDAPALTFICGDAKEAYEWRYQFTTRKGNPESKGFQWQDLPDTQMVMRAVDNPVQKAFRSALLVRGARPYTLIVDDIRKDDQRRLYEWLMQTPSDLEALTIKDHDLILGVPEAPIAAAKKENNGKPVPSAAAAAEASPRLLLRVLEVAAEPDNRLNDTGDLLRYETYNVRRSPNSGKDSDFGTGKRAVISAWTAAPDYKVLLFPHREGQPLPTTTWSADRKTLTIDDAGTKDVFTFAPLPDGRTGIVMRREGSDLFGCFGMQEATANSFGVKFDGTPASVSYEDGKLYLSGKGWKKLTFRGGAVREIVSDGSVGAASGLVDGAEVTEK